MDWKLNTEIRNSLERFSNTEEQAEDRISELESQIIKIIEPEEQKEKKNEEKLIQLMGLVETTEWGKYA